MSSYPSDVTNSINMDILERDCPLGFRRRRRHRSGPRFEDQPQDEEEEMVQAEDLGNHREGEQGLMENQDEKSM